ncbi:hypothetical protein AXX02_19170 [Pseudomonas aeruginosa]|nr:hypothetical protein AXX02_19170 [Pseudomonas aeruginosa]
MILFAGLCVFGTGTSYGMFRLACLAFQDGPFQAHQKLPGRYLLAAFDQYLHHAQAFQWRADGDFLSGYPDPGYCRRSA